MATLVRKALLTSGELGLSGDVTFSQDGRFLVVPLSWGGHTFKVVNVYLPCAGGGGDRAQQDFIRTHLHPIAQEPCLWGGDWNFVPDSSLDRISSPRPRPPPAAALGPAAAGAAARAADAEGAAAGAAAAGGGGGGAGAAGAAGAAGGDQEAGAGGAAGAPAPLPPPARGPPAAAPRPQGPGPLAHRRASGRDTLRGAADARAPRHPAVPTSAVVLQRAAPNMVDAFRALHPRQRSFTHHSYCSAARLDRWYCSSQFVTYLARCGPHTATPSDHRPVLLDLLPSSPSKLGKGYQRARPQHYWDDAAAREEFLEYLVEQAAAAPASDTPQGAQALLEWWPGFKQRLIEKSIALSRNARTARQQQQADQRADATEALFAAFDAVEACTSDADAAAALDGVLEARHLWRQAVRADSNATAWRMRRDWVHEGERPSKGLTQALASQSPPASRLVPGLQSPATGRTVLGGRPLANLVAVYWGNICSAKATDAAAQQAILQTVSDSGLKLTEEEASTLGGIEISAQEVQAAIKHSKPGTAPGLDGLPLEIYRKGALDTLSALLARVYTAMGQLGQVPAGLLDGVISIIYKKGQRSDPANYRPITVLNTDYRILAKVLGNRLRTVLPKLIQPEQTGFVPGRLIGENIMLNQLLPSALPQDSKAGIVFCDFHKAYDTVDRTFMLAVMERMNVGEGFLKWVKLLLNGTSACACVNGFVSRQVPTTGGVRQGCPLSPFLFLFISQAMLCLLKARGFGIDVGGRRITATAFADDTQPYLSDIFADTQVFRSVMQQFADASGEALNFDKSYLLPIGKEARVALWQQHFLPLVRQELPAAATEAEVVHEAHRRARQQFLLDGASVPEGQRIAGFKVVAQAAALGMLFNAKGHVSVDWESRLANVKGVFSYVSSLGLSVFGRAFAAAGYGISKLLYAAEYAGLPPQRILDELSRLQAKLVDRGLAPDTPGQHFAGVRAGLLPGHPKYGGFGAMPWKEHILGRHAMWGVRLMLGSDDTPWVYVARHLLGGNRQCPTFATLGIAMCTDAVLGPDGRHLCPALTRLAQGLQALPAWEDGAAEPLQPGPWCHSMPLWCNPFVMGQGAPGALPRRGLEAEFGDIAQLPTISTVGKARTALRAIEGACRPGEGPRLFQAEVWPNFLCSNALFQDRQHALERFTALLAAIPSCWTDAITNRDRGDVKEVLQDRLLPRLLWRLPGSNYGFCSLACGCGRPPERSWGLCLQPEGRSRWHSCRRRMQGLHRPRHSWTQLPCILFFSSCGLFLGRIAGRRCIGG